MNIRNVLMEYEKLDKEGIVAPVAHATITGHIAVTVDCIGNFAGASILRKQCYVPCTEESECRTSNVAPHLIHDNMSYVCELPGHEIRHSAYMQQLKEYISNVNDQLAEAVYEYVKNGNIMEDIEPVVSDFSLPKEKINICFYGYGLPEETVNRKWEEYYISTLPINGFCGVTGEDCYIPSQYPRSIRKQGDFARLFMRDKDQLNSMPGILPGYVTAQKIIHTLQTFGYSKIGRAHV